jgi:hypothetical protein
MEKQNSLQFQSVKLTKIKINKQLFQLECKRDLNYYIYLGVGLAKVGL